VIGNEPVIINQTRSWHTLKTCFICSAWSLEWKQFDLNQWGFSLTQACLSGFLLFGPRGHKGTRLGGHLELC